MASTPLRIDIVSDVVCPWCIVGYRQLQQAVAATGAEVDVHWHPFELNPNMPAEGQNLAEHIMEKYGSSKEESAANRDRLAQIGEGLGFEFSFSDDSRMYNTFKVHQLLHWAKEQGRGDDLKQAFFVAHFTDGRDLSDAIVLADVAAEAGFDRAKAEAVFADQRFAQDVRQAEQFWTGQGISGVPAMVFNQKYLVTGAQGADNYSRILTELQQMSDAAAE